MQSGNAASHTLELNWYLNPYTRIMADYVVNDVERLRNGVARGLMDVFEVRCHLEY